MVINGFCDPKFSKIKDAYERNFINGQDVKRYSGIGTATPDHVIRVKPFPLVISPKKNSSIE